MNRDLKQIIFKGECIDSNDPEKLGRIRAIHLGMDSGSQETASLVNGNSTYEPWDHKDPFLYKPLLPWFYNVTPKGKDEFNERGEYVHLFYSNIERLEGSNDRFYIGPIISSPILSYYDPIISSEKDLDEGHDVKRVQPRLINDDGTDISDVKGVYPGSEYMGFHGRGTADIVIQDNTVLLRAGKSFPHENKKLPLKNDERAFIQLSKYEFKTEKEIDEEYIEIQTEHKNIVKILEYSISNLENTVDVFNGDIRIYHLDIPEVTTRIQDIDSLISVMDKIPEGKKQIQTVISFFKLTLSNVAELINDVLSEIKKNSNIKKIVSNTDKYVISGYTGSNVKIGNENLLYNQDNFNTTGGTPLYFKPTNQMWELYSKSQEFNQSYLNAHSLIGKIKKPGSVDSNPITGYGLIYSKDRNSVDSSLKRGSISKKEIKKFDNSVGIMGANRLILMSHDTINPSKGKIDISDTLVGINEDKVVDELLTKTSSTVRGEELLEFLNLIVRFLETHEHPHHQKPPNEQGRNETITKTKIREALNEFSEKVLNKNIRIN